MWLLLVCILILLAIRWRVLSNRLRELQQRMDLADHQVSQLTARVYALEARPAVQPAPEPAPEAPAVPVPEPRLEPEPEPPPPLPPLPAPRRRYAGEEWEAVIGGNWLNKLGVLVLVIGISLLLRFSLAHLGAAGKVAIGLAAGFALLALGLATERRPRYRIFARGLVGGGWAAVYFTAYAMHGIEAARVIANPLAGIALLSTVAAAIILHSLRYRSQTVTGVAYVVGFATLALSPVTGFSLAASAPLAASLLFVSWRFGWSALPALGVALTYGVQTFRADPPPTGPILGGQAILWIYWLMFEGFDLLEIVRRRRRPDIARTLFPLNAAGFTGANLVHLAAGSTNALALFFAAASAVYLVSAVVRSRLEPLADPDRDSPAARLLQGYFGAVLASTLLAAVAIAQRFSGVTMSVAFAMQGQLLVFAGLRLRDSWLRALGAAVLALSAFRLVMVNLSREGTVRFLERDWQAWTPAALLLAAVFLLNRVLLGSGWAYTGGAALLLALTAGFEVRHELVAPVWLAMVLLLLDFDRRRPGLEFRIPAAALGLATFAAALRWDVFVQRDASIAWVRIALVLLAAGAYAAWWHLRIPGPSAAGTLFLAALLWHSLPAAAIAPGWAALALAAAIVSGRLNEPLLALESGLAGFAAFSRVLSYNLDQTHPLLPVAAAALFFHAAQFAVPWTPARGWFAVLGASSIALLLRDRVSGRLLTVAWGVQAVALLVAGFAARERVLRLSGLVIFLLCLGKLFAYDLRELDAFSRILSFIVLGLLLVGVSWVYTRFREQIRKYL